VAGSSGGQGALPMPSATPAPARTAADKAADPEAAAGRAR